MAAYAKRTLRDCEGETSSPCFCIRRSAARQMVICMDGKPPRAKALEKDALKAGSGALRLPWYDIEDVRHAAELGKGTSLHLPHQVRAMHLHGRFGDADIVGNLFV